MTAAENAPQLRSRLVQVLNVAQGYASGLDFTCGLVGCPFEQPLVRLKRHALQWFLNHKERN
jgi:hypothetical protein